MSNRTPIKRFLIGDRYIESRIEYKQAILRGQLALMVMVICVIYLLVDPLINQIYFFVPWYFVGIAVSLIILYLNRHHRFTAASILLILFGNILVFFTSQSGNPDHGAFIFFITTAAASLVLFYHKNMTLGLFFVGLSLVLAYLAFFMNMELLETTVMNVKYRKINFFINLTIGMLSSVVVLLFLIYRNKESEKSLLEKQQELQKLADELEKSREQYALALQGTEAGLFEWDLVHSRYYLSDRLLELLGYNREEVELRMSFFQSIIHPDDLEKTRNRMMKALATLTQFKNEARILCKDGQYRWFYFTGVIKSENGKAIKTVGSIINIDKRKKAEEALQKKNLELQKANEELDRFVYSASHDMRAPLTTIAGLLEVLKLTKDPAEYPQYFEMIRQRIEDMEAFIREVTDYSRNTRLPVENIAIHLRDFVDKIKESVAFMAEQNHIKVEVDIDKDIVIHTDPARLRVIFNNLINNAIKYYDTNKSKRYVKVLAKKESDDCRIEVIDNGMGIHEEYLAKVFDMFFRASEKSKGSGLGLYIVKETVEKLGGEITLSSTLGQGTHVIVRLPV